MVDFGSECVNTRESEIRLSTWYTTQHNTVSDVQSATDHNISQTGSLTIDGVRL
jgi:hypothetical protein